jgi:lipid-binding SYLF domain-containing protein
MTTLRISSALAIALALAGCSTAPRSPEGRDALDQTARATLNQLKLEDSSLGIFLSSAYGYAVFPSIGKGGLIAGGSYGKGAVYERGNLVGFADVSQATIGLQAGGQSFSQVIVFQTREKLADFQSGNFTFTGNASAVAVQANAAAGTQFINGVAIFISDAAGLMAEASVGGQRFTYQPAK